MCQAASVAVSTYNMTKEKWVKLGLKWFGITMGEKQR